MMESSNYLLAAGRIHPDQGLHLAIAVARMSGVPLVIVGPIEDQAYFNEQIEPHLDQQQIQYMGPSGGAALLGDALALVHLNTVPDRSSEMLSEAVAAGVPVIAMDLGGSRDVIADGVTGFLVDNVNQAVRALQRLPEIVRQA